MEWVRLLEGLSKTTVGIFIWAQAVLPDSSMEAAEGKSGPHRSEAVMGPVTVFSELQPVINLPALILVS